ncbi:MAG TPA: ribonucleoside hydrolase [Ruminococcaceae bacterium]|jgi:ribosylpyrimidine nucleosidase|nr:ribonucleoside hydrolase [Oscillospiraceae bacterium]
MEKIILDCDPGHDDAVAIMAAVGSPEIDLLAVTAVAGNQTVEKTSLNARKVLSTIGAKGIPVMKGMSLPLVRPSIICPEIHGETGLDGPKFAEPYVGLDGRRAVQGIIDILLASDGGITVVATGPLTNVAMAMRLEPEIIPKIKKIVIMGGTYQLGNITPAAEFNIFADAEAADIVFKSGRPLYMMTLDVTRKALVTKQVLDKMRSLNNCASELFVELMEFFAKTQKEVFGWDAPPLHDPVTIAYLIDPGCVVTKPMHVDIELKSEYCYGRTVCDYCGILKKPSNAEVGVDLDEEKFWNTLYNSLKSFSY